jgi:hypothetical protein
LSERTHKMKDQFGIWQTVRNWNLIGPISATCSKLNKHSKKQRRNGLSSYSVMNKAKGTKYSNNQTLHKMSTWVTPPSHSSNKKFPQTFWGPLTRVQDNGGTCYYFLANMQKYVTPEKRIWCANTIAMTGHCLSDAKIGPLEISRRFWFFSKACCSTFLRDVNQRSILEFQGQFACTALSILLFLRNHAPFPSITMDFSSGSESDLTLNRQSSTSTSISFVQLVKTLSTISNT